MRQRIERSSMATLAGLVPHYLFFYLGWSPLFTGTIAEWIMARTPSRYALWILEHLGAWAKPFSMTGALALLGLAMLLVALTPRKLRPLAAVAAALLYGWAFDYTSIPGQLSFWLPGVALLLWPNAPSTQAVPSKGIQRREALAMLSGTLLVAAEGYARESTLAGKSSASRELAPFRPPAESFGKGLVRNAVTPVDTFYAMSKNTVDPALSAAGWRLRVTLDGKTIRSLSHAELLRMPLSSEYVTLRCISNTLQSDLMGTALWTGVRLSQILDARDLPGGVTEIAVIGVDGHGDSFSVPYLLSDGVMLALGMNGTTLNRTHGFPARLIVPRYYGFKNVKWIGEIALQRTPYTGTWPKLGYTREPVVHTASHIDKIVRERDRWLVGGVAFAGDRGIRAVDVRAGGQWIGGQLEAPLARFTWTRWTASLPASSATHIEARAQDGMGQWQATAESALFPDGVQGPTLRRIS